MLVQYLARQLPHDASEKTFCGVTMMSESLCCLLV